MQWFKCGNTEIGLKELGYGKNSKMQLEYSFKLDSKELLKGNDLYSSLGYSEGLEGMAEAMLDYIIGGDFLSEDLREQVENRIEYGGDSESGYFIEKIS
jgi:hypothetical protein